MANDEIQVTTDSYLSKQGPMLLLKKHSKVTAFQIRSDQSKQLEPSYASIRSVQSLQRLISDPFQLGISMSYEVVIFAKLTAKTIMTNKRKG